MRKSTTSRSTPLRKLATISRSIQRNNCVMFIRSKQWFQLRKQGGYASSMMSMKMKRFTTVVHTIYWPIMSSTSRSLTHVPADDIILYRTRCSIKSRTHSIRCFFLSKISSIHRSTTNRNKTHSFIGKPKPKPKLNFETFYYLQFRYYLSLGMSIPKDFFPFSAPKEHIPLYVFRHLFRIAVPL